MLAKAINATISNANNFFIATLLLVYIIFACVVQKGYAKLNTPLANQHRHWAM